MSLLSARRFGTYALPLLLSATLAAQQAKVLAPHKPVSPQIANPKKWHSPAVMRSMVGGLWMMDANFKSSIHLKNNVETDPITVTPVLYLSNGQKYVLSEVKLEPAGVAVVSINQSLATKGIASYATLTGYVEIEYAWPWDALCVTVENIDVLHSMVFTYGLRSSNPFGTPAQPETTKAQVLEGLWWKQEENVTGFVALSNPTAKAMPVGLQISDGNGQAVGTHTVTVSPHGTKTVNLSELQKLTSAGGIRVAYTGSDDALIVNGGLEDQTTGYSAIISFGKAPSPSGASASFSYAELGLMTGASDPMMSFPVGTTFTPYSVFRNVADQPIQVTPIFWWMAGISPQSARLMQFTLQPQQALSLDVPSLLSAAGLKNFNGSVDLIVELQGPAGSLLMASGSVDQKNTYVFEVPPLAIQESQARSFSYWSTANGDDTMVTIWNPADESQDFVLTLFFTGGHYDFPIQLGPRATYTFNISEVIHNQIPDAEGNVVPSSVHEGSAKLSGTLGENQHILVALTAGTYNVVKATCIMECSNCVGPTEWWLDTVPFGVAVGSHNQLTFTDQYVSGSQHNLTASSTWSSSATTVATVSSGLVAGVSPGSVSVTATSPNVIVNGRDCQPYSPPPCPMQPLQSAGQGTVCDFTVAPPSGTAQDCKNGTLNSQTFNAQLYPTSCQFYASPQSSCTVPSATGTIDLAVGTPTCSISSLAAASKVQYYAGPAGSGSSAGTITEGFTLDIVGVGNVTHTVTAQIQCP